MEEKQSLNTIYVLKDTNNSVTLEINIGIPGQTSMTSILIDGDGSGDEINGNFPETIIGTSDTLDGKILFITSTVTDTSRDSNFTELIIRLKGGRNAKRFPLSKTVNEEGQSVPYIAVIKFIKIPKI